jgi:hypothetical protein
MLPDTLGLFDARTDYFFQPCAWMRHHVMATAAWNLKYHPRRRRRCHDTPLCELLESANSYRNIYLAARNFFVVASCQLNHAVFLFLFLGNLAALVKEILIFRRR